MRNMTPTSVSEYRIRSIDALRGFDMLMIVFADQFFSKLHEGAGSNFTEALALQFSHPQWFGFRFYDIIMPLFLFVVGAVIPFSLSKRMQSDTPKSSLFPKLLQRFLILFFLGWIVQGNLLDFDLSTFKIFSNTLQAIAVGYIFTSLAYLYLKPFHRYLLFVGCLMLYAILLTLPVIPGIGRSTLAPDVNFALYVDHLVFGSFDDGKQYTWLLTGLGFTATTLSGLFAGERIKNSKDITKVFKTLLLLGAVFVGTGLLANPWHPVVKKIWSSSFVLVSSGICYLLLAIFYWIIDVKQQYKWAFFLKIIGRNAITAYVITHVFPFPKIVDFVLYGLAPYTGKYYELITVIGGFGLLYLLLWYMYKNKTFIKV
jgi:predicted acyltransferase